MLTGSRSAASAPRGVKDAGMHEFPQTIVHIIGCSRSGSTILDRTLGHHSQAFSIGEIINFQPEYQENHICGCGKLLHNCGFWNEVLRRIGKATGESPEALVRAYQLNPSFTASSRLSKTLSKLKHGAGLLLRLPPQAFTDTKVFEKTGLLYDAVFQLSGKRLLIDSSKSISRALLLSRSLKQYKHRFIHLVRDGRGVVHSKLKKSYSVKIKDDEGNLVSREIGLQHNLTVKDAADDWVKVNRKADRVIAFTGIKDRSTQILFEEFLAQPEQVITGFLDSLGLPFEPEMLSFTYGDNHMVCGNSSRLNAIRLRKEENDWDALLSPEWIQIFNERGGKRLNEKYGYQ